MNNLYESRLLAYLSGIVERQAPRTEIAMDEDPSACHENKPVVRVGDLVNIRRSIRCPGAGECCVVMEVSGPLAVFRKTTGEEFKGYVDSFVDSVLKHEYPGASSLEFLGHKHSVVATLSDICRDVQLNPLRDGPKVDAVSVHEVVSVDDGDHVVATFFGGANGGGRDGKIEDYMMLIRKLAATVSDRFKSRVWLVDWVNDCADDVWTLRLGFECKEVNKKPVCIA